MNGEPGKDADEIPPSGDSEAWTALGYVISGPLLYGGIGYLLDRWLGTIFITPIGIIGGMALAFYLLFVRYGTR